MSKRISEPRSRRRFPIEGGVALALYGGACFAICFAGGAFIYGLFAGLSDHDLLRIATLIISLSIIAGEISQRRAAAFAAHEKRRAFVFGYTRGMRAGVNMATHGDVEPSMSGAANAK